jgi:hypothetical protein
MPAARLSRVFTQLYARSQPVAESFPWCFEFLVVTGEQKETLRRVCDVLASL